MKEPVLEHTSGSAPLLDLICIHASVCLLVGGFEPYVQKNPEHGGSQDIVCMVPFISMESQAEWKP